MKVKSDHCSKFSNFSNVREDMNSINWPPMCGFIVQLVEHRTGIVEVTGSNPVEALIFLKLENILR